MVSFTLRSDSGQDVTSWLPPPPSITPHNSPLSTQHFCYLIIVFHPGSASLNICPFNSHLNFSCFPHASLIPNASWPIHGHHTLISSEFCALYSRLSIFHLSGNGDEFGLTSLHKNIPQVHEQLTREHPPQPAGALQYPFRRRR